MIDIDARAQFDVHGQASKYAYVRGLTEELCNALMLIAYSCRDGGDLGEAND